jgi:hypothetical protein
MMRNYKKLLSTMAMTGFLTGAGCLGGAPVKQTTVTTAPSTTSDPAETAAENNINQPNNPTDPNNTSSGGTANTFNHESDQTTDPFQELANIEQEGPPEFATRMHSCGKMRYVTIGNVLADLGVNMKATATTSAAVLYTSGAGALAQPNYPGTRLAESRAISTSGAERLYDIFVAAAPEVIAAMPTNARCDIAGTATSMFDSSGACTAAGISCLTGAPSQSAQVDLCNAAVASDTTDMIGTAPAQYTIGQVIAVASLLSAAHSCE